MKGRDKRRRAKAQHAFKVLGDAAEKAAKRMLEPLLTCRIVRAKIDRSVCKAGRDARRCDGCEHLTC